MMPKLEAAMQQVELPTTATLTDQQVRQAHTHVGGTLYGARSWQRWILGCKPQLVVSGHVLLLPIQVAWGWHFEQNKVLFTPYLASAAHPGNVPREVVAALLPQPQPVVLPEAVVSLPTPAWIGVEVYDSDFCLTTILGFASEAREAVGELKAEFAAAKVNLTSDGLVVMPIPRWITSTGSYGSGWVYTSALLPVPAQVAFDAFLVQVERAFQ